MAEIVHHRHVLQRAGQAFDGFQLVRAIIDAAVNPVDQGVAARLRVVQVLHTDDFTFGREIDFHGIVAAAQGMPLHIAAIGLAAPDAAGQAIMYNCAFLADDLVALAPMAPVQPAVGMQEGTVNVRRVACVVKAADDQFALVRHAVAIGVSELPQAGWRAHIQGAVEPACALREGHFVGKDRALVEYAVAVGVLQHEHAVGRVLFELLFVPVHARGIADEEAALVIQAAHDGMRDQRRGGDGKQFHAGGQFRLGSTERGVVGAAGDHHRALGALRDVGGGVGLEISGLEKAG